MNYQYNIGWVRSKRREKQGSRKCVTQLSTEEQQRKRQRMTEDEVISFAKEDMTHVTTPKEDAVVITSTIDRFDTKRILINGGS